MALSTMGGRGARGVSHAGHHHHSMDPNGGGNGGTVFGDIVVYVQVNVGLGVCSVKGVCRGSWLFGVVKPRHSHTNPTQHDDRR